LTELLWRQVPQRRMRPLCIVESDVAVDIFFGFQERGVFLKPNRFLFQRPEPALDVRIGVGIVVARTLLLDSGIHRQIRRR
jgi:hypothetical protein